MVRLLTALGLVGLLLALLSFGAGGIPLGPTEERPRRRTRAVAPRSGAREEAIGAAPDPEPAAPASPPGLRQPVRTGGLARRALGWLLYLAFVVGAIATIPSALGWALNSPNPIAAVSGSSMWPTLSKGDLVFLQGVDDVEDLHEGDIIAFRQENGFAIHRIISIDGPTITTRGDGNFVDDAPITIDEVIGKVPTVYGRLARIPLLGHLSLVFGPLISQSNDVRPKDPPLQPIQDLATENTGRILAPVEDLAGQRLTEDPRDPPGAAHEGTPVADLRQASGVSEPHPQ